MRLSNSGAKIDQQCIEISASASYLRHVHADHPIDHTIDVFNDDRVDPMNDKRAVFTGESSNDISGKCGYKKALDVGWLNKESRVAQLLDINDAPTFQCPRTRFQDLQAIPRRTEKESSCWIRAFLNERILWRLCGCPDLADFLVRSVLGRGLRIRLTILIEWRRRVALTLEAGPFEFGKPNSI